MDKELISGMSFENLQKLCDYIEWDFNGTHPDRIKKKMQKYFSFHKVGKSKIVIDDVYCKLSEMKLIKKKSPNTYLYNVGQILNTTSGKIQILALIHIENSKGYRHVGYRCLCLECGYIFEDYEYNIKKGVGCGCCAGKIVVKGINDLWTTAPEIARLLKNPDDGYKYTKFSSKRADFICPICGEILQNRKISNVAIRGLACACMRTKSVPNRMMYWTLRNLNVEFDDEKQFTWSNSKKYDFYIPSLNIIVEMNGGQHYQKSSFQTKTLEGEIKNDQYKYNMAMQAGIDTYIVIECKSSDFYYIRKHILESELNLLLPLNTVDWDWVKEKVYMSIILTIADKWNYGVRDVNELASCIGVKSKETVKKYYNLAVKYGYILNQNVS